MKRVVIINGMGGCGKDTFVTYCLFPYVNISTIDPIKIVAKELGWDEVKDEKGRKFLSDLKKAATDYNDYCNQYIFQEYEKFLIGEEDNYKHKEVIFIHVREPENIEKIKENIPEAITLLLTNDRVTKIESNESDRRVFDYEYDCTIDNSGTLAELEQKAIQFCIDYLVSNEDSIE